MPAPADKRQAAWNEVCATPEGFLLLLVGFGPRPGLGRRTDHGPKVAKGKKIGVFIYCYYCV